MSLSSSAEVFLPHTEADEVDDAMIEAYFDARRVKLKPCCYGQPRMSSALCEAVGLKFLIFPP
jgi:hypothetical protein